MKSPGGDAMLERGFSALRYRNFRLYWFGQMISLVGTWMQWVAQAWLVLQLTNSPLLLGVVTSLQTMPVLVLGLYGGVVADRIPKRTLLLITQTTSMLLAFVLAVLTSLGLVAYWHVLVLAALLGTVTAFDMPARQAFVAEVVEPADLLNAVALNSAIFNAARLIGPAVAGIIIGSIGVAAAFYVNGVSFLAVIAGLLSMRVHVVRHVGLPSSVLESVVEGLSYVRTTSTVLTIILLIALVGTFGMNFSVLIPVFAQDVLHVGATGFGFLMSAMGAGSLVTALALAYVGQRSTSLIVWGALALAVFELAFALSPLYPLSLLLMVGMGWAMVTFLTTANTTLQLATPSRLRGRVMSLYTIVFIGSTPIGSLIIGGLANVIDPRAAMAVGALLSGAAALWAMRRPVPHPREDAAEEPESERRAA
ncbi:MAG: MFS transporter [Chloroflexota bacterium]|nr:MAG: MFS transporter [Chloroflexota bacterium]